MFFNSVKEIKRLRKEINRSKVTIEGENWRSQNFDLKNVSPCHSWGAPTHKDIIEF